MGLLKQQIQVLFKQGLKQCPKCPEPKPLSEFGNNKTRKDRLQTWCKEHCKEDRDTNKQYHKEYYVENKNTILKEMKLKHLMFPWKKILKDIKQRCNNSKATGYINYGGRGIKCLITENELKQLWFRDKAYNLKQPSIDRKDSDGNYEFDNCEFIELVENIAKDKRKPILQYDLEGNFIKEWSSQSVAIRYLKISSQNINNCCKGRSKTAGGFKWEYKDEQN